MIDWTVLHGDALRPPRELRAASLDAAMAAPPLTALVRVTRKERTAEWVVQIGKFTAQSHRGQRGAQYERGIEAPAPSVTGNAGRWTVKGMRMDGRENATERSVDDEPAPTVLFGHASNDVSWVHERPATAVSGEPRIAKPGYKGDAEKERGAIRQMEGAIRVKVQEALVLQSFRPDYPMQRSRTAQFAQVGNAVAPLLARAILAELVEPAAEAERAA